MSPQPTITDLENGIERISLASKSSDLHDLERRVNKLSRTLTRMNLDLVDMYWYIQRHDLDEPVVEATSIAESPDLPISLNLVSTEDVYGRPETPRPDARNKIKKKLRSLEKRLPDIQRKAAGLYSEVEKVSLEWVENQGVWDVHVRLLRGTTSEFREVLRGIKEGVERRWEELV